MSGKDVAEGSKVELFDGEDVDVGEEAPDDTELTAEELAGISASQADPDAPAADTDVS